jgi:2-methylcitrate dehydratase PrpD
MTSDPPLLLRLAQMILDACRQGVPDEVSQSVQLRVLDILGLCVAAADLDTSLAMRDYVCREQGIGESTGIGCATKMPASMAALLNGTLAHSLDFDDTHLPSVVHPSASVIPACIATGEAVGTDGRRLVGAIAGGIEACIRLGMAGYDKVRRNSLYFDRGQHATAMCGAIAAAGSCAALMDLEVGQVADAMGLAVSMAGGVIEANRAGGTVKRIHCGWAAHSATVAAHLARLGFTGPPTALEGRFGFFQAFLSGNYDRSVLIDGLGESWSVQRVNFKPYPANHFTHAGIDAAIQLRSEGLLPDDVRSLTLGVSAPVIHTIGEPIAAKRRPETGYQAQFSGPYTVVAALLGGHGLGLGLEDFTDELAIDPYRRALMDLVDVVEDAECSERFPEQFSAVLSAVTEGGETLVARIMSNRGGYEWPLSRAEINQKFAENAGRGLDSTAIGRIEELTDALTEAPALDGLMGLLGRLGEST